ncbi:hypothetical protein Gotri_025774 [Gossypium trilobum]|uniref:DUF4283 domain-containing protein n=1 Tax=Gossypium trilobum TaxID=34281 RepID=A0A7J9FKQ6_9ROSI|nr:hypothetical protein [Gossypium trilobum]
MMVVGDKIVVDQEYGLCLVGQVLTDSIVNFSSLKNTLADLWHLLREVSIMEIEHNCILFRFYSKIDLKRVMDGMPWFFNRHLIMFHRARTQFKFLFRLLFSGNLPIGFLTKGMARQFRDFIRKFLESDALLVMRGWARMEIEGESREIRFGADVTNQSDHREGKGSEGHFVRHIRKPMDKRSEDRVGQFEEMGERSEFEDFPVEFVDGKKRQRFHTEVGDFANHSGLLELGIGN